VNILALPAPRATVPIRIESQCPYINSTRAACTCRAHIRAQVGTLAGRRTTHKPAGGGGGGGGGGWFSSPAKPTALPLSPRQKGKLSDEEEDEVVFEPHALSPRVGGGGGGGASIHHRHHPDDAIPHEAVRFEASVEAPAIAQVLYTGADSGDGTTAGKKSSANLLSTAGGGGRGGGMSGGGGTDGSGGGGGGGKMMKRVQFVLTRLGPLVLAVVALVLLMNARSELTSIKATHASEVEAGAYARPLSSSTSAVLVQYSSTFRQDVLWDAFKVGSSGNMHKAAQVDDNLISGRV